MVNSAQLSGYKTARAYEDAVLTHVRSELEAHLARLLESGDALPRPDELASAMSAALPDARVEHPFAALGPYYSSRGVMRVLRIDTKQALDDRRRRGTVLGAKTSQGTWVYPAFQFDLPKHRVRTSMVEVLAQLKDAPRWGAVLWLRTPHPDLDGAEPIDALGVASSRDRVVALAREYVHAVAGE